jgi:Domain of unknown function (DUF4267)
MIVNVALVLSGLIGVGIIAIGARFLVSPMPSAAAFGVPGSSDADRPWLSVKGVRDIASGLFTLLLLAYGHWQVLGAFMLAASVIPLGDALIVLRSGGSKAAAYAIHGLTCLVMVVAGLILVLG